MIKNKKSIITGFIVGLITLQITTTAFSGSINLKEVEAPVWIFIIGGGVIILFQLIPAAMLFFSFIGTTSLILLKLKKVLEELPIKERERVVLPGYEPTSIKKKESRFER